MYSILQSEMVIRGIKIHIWDHRWSIYALFFRDLFLSNIPYFGTVWEILLGYGA